MASQPSIGLIKIILLLPAVAYLGLLLYASMFANKLVFPAPPAGYKDSPDIVKFPYDADGQTVSMVYLENPRSPFLVFYHHGNGEDLQGILPRLRYLRELGYSVLSWDYPGYGTSDGKSSEKLVLRVAKKILNSIPRDYGYPLDKVILYGRSVGSGPAVWLANQEKPAGLILEGAFTSIFRVGLGLPILPWDLFNNQAIMGSINCPVLILHGTDDQTTPFSHATRLYELAPEPKFFAWMNGGTHNDLIDNYSETYRSSLDRFSQFIANSQ